MPTPTQKAQKNHDAEQPAEPQVVHKETVTFPTITAMTTSTTATPTEQWVGDNVSEPRTPSRKSRRLATVGLTPVKKDCSCNHNADHSSNCVGPSSSRGNQPPEARRPIGWSKNATERAKANANSYSRVGGGFNFWCGRCQKKRNMVDPRKPPKRPKVQK